MIGCQHELASVAAERVNKIIILELKWKTIIPKKLKKEDKQ